MRFSNIIFRTLSSGFCHPEERSDEGSGSGSVILSNAKDLFLNLVILSKAKNLAPGCHPEERSDEGSVSAPVILTTNGRKNLVLLLSS